MARPGPIAGEFVLSAAAASGPLFVTFDMSHSTRETAWTACKLWLTLSFLISGSLSRAISSI